MMKSYTISQLSLTHSLKNYSLTDFIEQNPCNDVQLIEIQWWKGYWYVWHSFFFFDVRKKDVLSLNSKSDSQSDSQMHECCVDLEQPLFTTKNSQYTHRETVLRLWSGAACGCPQLCPQSAFQFQEHCNCNSKECMTHTSTTGAFIYCYICRASSFTSMFHWGELFPHQFEQPGCTLRSPSAPLQNTRICTRIWGPSFVCAVSTAAPGRREIWKSRTNLSLSLGGSEPWDLWIGPALLFPATNENWPEFFCWNQCYLSLICCRPFCVLRAQRPAPPFLLPWYVPVPTSYISHTNTRKCVTCEACSFQQSQP